MRTSVMAVALVAAAACGRPGPATEQAGPPPVLLDAQDLVVAREGTVADGPLLAGTLRPEREARVRAELAGAVLATLADPGTPVAAGQPLARLESTTAEEDVASARAGVRSAETAQAVAARDLQRYERLYEGGAVSPQSVDVQRRAATAAEAAVADARARLASAEQRLSKATVRAPFAGVVSERAASAGDVVQPGTALYTVVDPASLVLEAAVPAAALGRLRPGTAVSFSLSGFPGEQFTGRVARINPAADAATRQVRIEVTVPNPDRRLVAGLFAEGRVQSDVRTAVTLPRAAVDVRGLRPSVVRVRQGRAERVEVVVGLSDPVTERVEVRQGVAAGDTVLTGAALTTPAGAMVRVRAAVERGPAAARKE